MPAPTTSASINGAASNTTPSASTTSNAASGRGSVKMTTSKMDSARKQAGSPVDGAQKKPAQKAWTSGTNPITQRTSTPTASNGITSSAKMSTVHSTAATSAKETNTPEKHANDRLIFLMANFVGLPAVILTKNGERFSGIFSTPSLEPSELRYVLKMVKKVQPEGDQLANGNNDAYNDYVGTGDDQTKVFNVNDVVDLAVVSVPLTSPKPASANGAAATFRTDTEISGNMSGRERQLQRWLPDADSNVDLSLEDSGRGQWDQFDANQRLFGLASNYDENIYTTAIDRSHPEYRTRAEKAERIAREIESSTSLTAHVAEERGKASVDDSGMDEEDKYSGVRRGGDFPPLPTGQPNKYTPPARRSQASQAPVPAPPADPAIISVSSALNATAKPQSSENKPTVKIEDQDKYASTTKSGVDSNKPDTDSRQVSGSSAAAAAKPATPKVNEASGASTNPKTPIVRAGENATATVERDVLHEFKQFKAIEKYKMQERHRQQSKANMEVKLNDLKKFSQNFKLNTPVPQDLIPILAKDKDKQDEIVTKALKQAEEVKITPVKSTVSPQPDQKAQRPAPNRFENGQSSPTAAPDRQNVQRGRSGQGSHTQQGRNDRTVQGQNVPTIPPHRQGPLPLGQRLTLNQQAHRQNMGQPPMNPPNLSELRIPSQGAASSNGVTSPTSSVSTRFNAAAIEFRPNVGAKSFQPSSASHTPSPRRESAPRIETKKSPVSFWGDRKRTPRTNRPDLKNSFNPVKRMKKDMEQEKSTKFSNNQGIPPAYHTPPTWEVPKDNLERTHIDLLGRPPMAQASISPGHAQLHNGSMPHVHQLPPHLQNGPSGHVPQNPNQTPRHMPIQPHQPGNHHPYNDHPMHYNQSHSVQPSPRNMPATYVQYPAQGASVPMYQQSFQNYGMPTGAPPITMRQMSSGGPQFIGPQGQVLGGQVMSHSPSSGPFMQPMNPQMQMFTPTQSHVYPHPGPYPPQPGPNGFGSPGPRIQAPMMSHQGSQQGPAPQQVVYMSQGVNHNSPAMFTQNPAAPMTPMRGPYAQPHYGPNQHYPQPQFRGTPQTSHAQVMMPQHGNMQPQGPPSGPQGPSHIPSDGQASEDVK